MAPWFEEQGFIRGDNEPCAFYHPERDLLIILYVDDCLADGHEDDINWIFHLMDARFACKDAEWLDIESPLDYLGMDISQDDEFIYLSSLVKPLHVPSEDNLADIFTKILDKPTFINLRDRLLHQKKLAAA